MPTRNVYLPALLDDFVTKAIATGRYSTASEVMREALRLLIDESEKERSWARYASRLRRSEIAK